MIATESLQCVNTSVIFCTCVLLKNLVTADKTGDWERHLVTAEKLTPLSEQLHRINYLRYTSLYQAMMRKLPEQFPEIYKQLIKENFAVKTRSRTYNGVASDMKLEQTTQR